MDDYGPRLRHLTKPAQLDQKRFVLEWIVPLEPGLSTHVALYDLECDPPHAVAVGDGGDEAEALLDLWTTLNEPAIPRKPSPTWPRRIAGELADSRSGRSSRRIDRQPSAWGR